MGVCSIAGCRVARNAGARAPQAEAAVATGIGRLPTGVRFDPAGRSIDVGSFPLAAVLSPDRTRSSLLLNGWREQGVQVVDRATGAVQQTLPQHAAFLGLAFSPDGSTLYASGGDQDVVYRYAWRGDSAMLTDSIVLAPRGQSAPRRTATPRGSHPPPTGGRCTSRKIWAIRSRSSTSRRGTCASGSRPSGTPTPSR